VSVRVELEELIRYELNWEGELPSGSIAESLDSLQLMSLALVIEEQFGVTLTVEDNAGAMTFDEIVGWIEQKKTKDHG